MVSPDLLTQPRTSSEVKLDGSIVSKPMEDLWPFLDREEFKANMIIEPLEK
jgi:acetolactate synthase-1/2/3 large subunit